MAIKYFATKVCAIVILSWQLAEALLFIHLPDLFTWRVFFMSSIFFQFYYDDGSMRPFDPDAAMELDTTRYEAPEVTCDGLIDFFLMTPFDLSELGLSDPALYPPFIKNFDEDAPDEGLGIEDNIWYENMTLSVEPADLKAWAQKWPPALELMGAKKRREALVNWKYVDEIVHNMQQLERQADCAMSHNIKIMLFVAW